MQIIGVPFLIVCWASTASFRAGASALFGSPSVATSCLALPSAASSPAVVSLFVTLLLVLRYAIPFAACVSVNYSIEVFVGVLLSIVAAPAVIFLADAGL